MICVRLLNQYHSTFIALTIHFATHRFSFRNTPSLLQTVSHLLSAQFCSFALVYLFAPHLGF